MRDSFEMRANIAYWTLSTPKPCAPSTSREDAPQKSYHQTALRGIGSRHIPLQFCPAQGNLSGGPFNPYTLRLTSLWDQTFLVAKTDMDRLLKASRGNQASGQTGRSS